MIIWGTGWWVDRTTSPLVGTDPKIESTYVAGLTFPTTTAGAKVLSCPVRCAGADTVARIYTIKKLTPTQVQSTARATMTLDPPMKADPIEVSAKVKGTLLPNIWQGASPVIKWLKTTLPAGNYPQSEIGITSTEYGASIRAVGNKANFDIAYFTGDRTGGGHGHSTVSKQFPKASPWNYGNTGTTYPAITWRVPSVGSAPYEGSPAQTVHCLSPGGHYFVVGNKADTSNVLWFYPPGGSWAATTQTVTVTNSTVACFAVDATNFYLFDRVNVAQSGSTNQTWRWRKWNGSTWTTPVNLVFYTTKGYIVQDLAFVHGPAGSNIVYIIHTLNSINNSDNTWCQVATFNTSTNTFTAASSASNYIGSGNMIDQFARWIPPYYTYDSDGTYGYISLLASGNSNGQNRTFCQFRFALATPGTVTFYDQISPSGLSGSDKNVLWTIEYDPNTNTKYFCVWEFTININNSQVVIKVWYRPLINGAWSGPYTISGTPTDSYANASLRALAAISPQAGNAGGPTVLWWDYQNGVGGSAFHYVYEMGVELWSTYLPPVFEADIAATAKAWGKLTQVGGARFAGDLQAASTITGEIVAKLYLGTASAAAQSFMQGVMSDYVPLGTITLPQHYVVTGTTYVQDFLDLVNTRRAQLGLAPFLNAGVDQLSIKKAAIYDPAQVHARNMAVAEIVVHDSDLLPPGEQTAHDRVAHISSAFAENNQANPFELMESDPAVVYGAFTAQAVYDNWMNSPPHKANIERDWGSLSDSMYLFFGLDIGYYDPDGAGTLYGPHQYRYVYIATVYAYLSEVYVEVNLGQQWANTGAVISILNQGWSNASYERVLGDHSALYAIRLATAHEIQYSQAVQLEHVAPMYYSLQADHQADYTQTVKISGAEHSGTYDIHMNPVAQSHEAPMPLNLVVDHEASYEPSVQLVASNSAEYTDYTRARAESLMVYRVYGYVASSHTASYTETTGIAKQHEAPIVYPTPLKTSHQADYDLSQYDRVTYPHSSFYTLLDATIMPSVNEVVLYHGASRVRLDDGYVSTRKGDAGYRFQSTIEDLGVFASMTEGDPLLVDFCGEQYILILATKSVERNAVGHIKCTITAGSPALFLDFPYVGGVDYVPDTDMTAKAMVEQLLDDLVTWEVAEWTIPKGRVQITKASPLSAIKTIVGAVGASLTSEPDGSAVVRYAYPYNWDKLQDFTPDHTYSDVQHNLSASQTFEYREGYNTFRVRDSDSSYGDRIEWTVDEVDPFTGIARVYPSPYRDSWQLRTTTPAGVIVDMIGETTEQFTEVVEFRAGRASTRNPIFSLDTVVWKSTGLEAVSFVPYGVELTAATTVNEGYGLAEITYSSKSHHFKVTASTEIDVTQLIVQEN